MQDSIRTYADVMNGDELAKQLLAEVHRSAEIRTSDNDTHIKLDEIKKILEDHDKNLIKELQDLKKTVEDTAKSVSRGPGSSGSASASAKANTVSMGNLAVAMTKTYNAINGLNKTLMGGVNLNMSKTLERALAGGGGGKGPGGGSPAAPGAPGGGPLGDALAGVSKSEAKRLDKAGVALAAATMTVNKAISMFSGGLSSIGVDVSKVYSGAMKDATIHVQDMRSFIYETQGAGVAMTDLEKKFINLERSAAETGMMRGEVQKLYRKEMQKGLTTEVVAGKVQQRNATDTMRLTKNTLRTANMIGASAEGTAELFSEWNRHLGMTNEQLSFVGREMEQVARNSGVTGDELLAATKAASILVKEVRNFAGISQQAMAQIIQTQTSLQKFGAEDIGAKFNQAMSQGIRSLAQAEPVIASIIAESANRAGQSMTGSMLTGGSQQRKMQQEIMKTLRGRLGAIGLGGVDPAQLLDKLEEMRDAGQDTGILEQQIKNVTGMGAGELQNLYKSYQEASMSFGDRMKGFEDRIANATSPEGKALAERQRADFMKADQRQQLSTFSDLLGRKGDLNQAVEQFNQRMQREGRADAVLRGPDAARQLAERGVGNLAQRGKEAGVDLNAILKKRGLTQEGLQRGLLDPKSAKEFAGILQEVENEVLTQEKANQDPVLKANLELKKANDQLVGAIQKLYMAFVSFELIMGAAVALMAAKAGMSLMSLSNITGLFGKGGRLLGKAGGAAGRMLGVGGTRAAAGAGTRVAAGVGTRVAGGVAAKAAVSGGAKVAGIALGASNPVGWIVTAAAALGGGFVNAMESAAKATEIFNTTQEKLTYTQKAAAKSAGFLTGVLDFISFGIFDKYIGPTGTWTVALAHFFDEFWPLALLGDVLLKPFELLWALIKGIGLGIWEYWKGLWEGIKAVWTPISEAFMQLKNEILVPIAGAFEDVFGAGSGNIDMMKTISDTLKQLGKWAGEAAKWIGEKLGAAIRFMIPFIKTGAQFLASVLVPAFKALFKVLQGAWNIISGIFTLDGTKIKEGFKQIFADAPKLIWQMVQNMVSFIWTGLKLAFNWIVTEVPKLLWQGFVWLITEVPKLLWQAFVWLITEVPKFLFQGFMWLVTGVGEMLAKGFMWLVTDLPKMLWETFTGVLNDVWNWLKEKVGLGEDQAGGKVLSAGSKLLDGDILGAGGDLLSAGGKVVETVWDNTGGAIIDGLGDAADAVGDWLGLDVGSMGIKTDGPAYLHKGEMVIPAGLSDIFRGATSSGPFAEDTFVGKMARQASNALGLGLFDSNQGKEASSTGLDSWLNQLTAPASSIVDSIASIFGMGGGRQEQQQQQGGGSWFDRIWNTITGKKEPEPKKISIEEYLQAIADNGVTTNKLVADVANMLNKGLFESTNISDAIYESNIQSEKQFDNMFAGTDAVKSVIVEAQEVLLGEVYASDEGLFAPEQITEAMDVLNTDVMQQQQSQKSIWELGSEAFDRIFNPENVQQQNSGGGIWDSLTRTWDEITGRTERAISNPIDTGLFAASNARETFMEAMQGTINNPVSRLMDMFGFGGGSKPAASAGSSLYYNNQDEYTNATTQTGAAGGTTNNYVNQGRRMRGLPVKGSVSSNLLSSSGDAEDYIIQSRLLSQPSGSGAGGVASALLERIADAVESGRLDEIIILLTAIRDKDSNVLINAGGGGGSGGAPSVEGSGLRDGYNKAWLNGDWTHLGDPAYSDNANILGTSRG